MSVLIKNMDMPDDCGECHFCHTENFHQWCCLTDETISSFDVRHFMCPLADLPIKEKCAYCPHCDNCDVNDDLSIAQPDQQHGRIFQEIVVEYPSYNTYPEYKGKPYFSIKYTENGQEFICYGTYKPEVLSEYLKEYFMPSAQPAPCEFCKHNDMADDKACLMCSAERRTDGSD